jgi:hypothetical protein
MNYLEDLELDGRIIIELIIKEKAGRTSPGVTEVRIGAGVGIL